MWKKGRASFLLCGDARSRVAAILLGIDANDLNNVFASRHLIIFKIGGIGNLLACYEHACPNDARTISPTVKSEFG